MGFNIDRLSIAVAERNRITTNPKVVVGKPVIKGTRLTVEYILNLLAHGLTVTAILDEYKGLVEAAIQACLLCES